MSAPFSRAPENLKKIVTLYLFEINLKPSMERIAWMELSRWTAIKKGKQKKGI
jgi:hypothetical protein